MSMFKDVADIKTADQLHLPAPEAKFETVVVQPSEIQKEMVADLSERAAAVHSGNVDPRSIICSRSPRTDAKSALTSG